MKLFSVFSRVADGVPRPIKAYMSLSHYLPRVAVARGLFEKSQNRYWLYPAARAAAKALQYNFDGRSFNINCGFSADGNVFFIAGVTLWWSGRPAVCDAAWYVVDELLFCTLNVSMRLFGYEYLSSFVLVILLVYKISAVH